MVLTCMSWSPDQEIVAFTTGMLKVLVSLISFCFLML